MNLPPLHLHPEKYCNWTEPEKHALTEYGQQCAKHALARAIEIIENVRGTSRYDAIQEIKDLMK